MITQEYLKSILSYNKETGEFIWKRITSGISRNYTQVGCKDNAGYVIIGIDNKVYKAHRLVCLYEYGSFPRNQIDHIDGIKWDNRIINLREVTPQENQRNRKEHREGKPLGITFHKASKKWRAQIRINKKQVPIGVYSTKSKAHKAYLAMEWLILEVQKLWL